MKTIELLTAARALIANPGNWCSGSLEYNGRHCAMGAILKAANIDCFGTAAWNTALADNPTVRDATVKLASAIPVNRFIAERGAYDIYKDPDGMRAWDTVAVHNNTEGHEAILEAFDLTIARQLVIDSMAEETVLNKPVQLAELVG